MHSTDASEDEGDIVDGVDISSFRNYTEVCMDGTVLHFRISRDQALDLALEAAAERKQLEEEEAARASRSPAATGSEAAEEEAAIAYGPEPPPSARPNGEPPSPEAQGTQEALPSILNEAPDGAPSGGINGPALSAPVEELISPMTTPELKTRSLASVPSTPPVDEGDATMVANGHCSPVKSPDNSFDIRPLKPTFGGNVARSAKRKVDLERGPLEDEMEQERKNKEPGFQLIRSLDKPIRSPWRRNELDTKLAEEILDDARRAAGISGPLIVNINFPGVSNRVSELAHQGSLPMNLLTNTDIIVPATQLSQEGEAVETSQAIEPSNLEVADPSALAF
jgi:hypothetical protein